MLKEHNIQKNVFKKIRMGNVPMRSRVYFILRSVLVGAISVFVLVVSIFALGFVFFSIHESGEGFLLEFGEHGLTTLVTLFPWMSLILFLFLFIALGLFIHKFTSAYRFPLIRIFLWILVIGITGSTLISFTPINSFLLSEADKDELPIIGSLYENIHDSHTNHGVYRGEITSVAESYFVISHNDTDRDSDEGSWFIIPPSGFSISTISIGKKVYVAGRIMNGVVYAYGIHLISDDE